MTKGSPIPFGDNLTILAQVTREVARARRLSAADAQDFTQSVYVKFIEQDYQLFRRFEGRSTVRTYLSVAVNRMSTDWLNATYGKWRPSSMARRLGPTGIALDRLINRDGYSTDEAVAAVVRDGSDTTASLLATAQQLPRRSRRRFVSDEMVDGSTGTAFKDPVAARDDARARKQIGRALRRALGQLPSDERQLIARRFGHHLTVPALAAELQIEPKALYRRFERSLRFLRSRLTAAGVTGSDAVAVPSSPGWNSQC